MSVSDSVLPIPLQGDLMVGILSRPSTPVGLPVIMVVGGPQYRAGSHRLYRHVARRLAFRGHAVLRFDVRGMGDSSGEPRTFENLTEDIGAAIDAIAGATDTSQGVALWGLCDGASAALLYHGATRDLRVRSMCLVNPWVRAEATLARVRLKHYYAQRLLEPAFWRKLVSGRVGLGAISELRRSLQDSRRPALDRAASALPYTIRMLEAAERFDGALTVILSGDDFTAREFDETTAADPRWRKILARYGTTRVDVPGADHTFSCASLRDRLADITAQHLGSAQVALS